MTVTIEEVVKRVEQGQTSPYLCRGDDGHVYFVKSRALPRRELVAEWLAANLAQAVGLPLPPFCLAQIPEELCDPALGSWLSDLAPGAAFASRRVEAVELTWYLAPDVPPQDRALIAAFDWWIHNADRSLSEHGGNPNLLWQHGANGGQVVVIDHNLAFELDFDAEAFFASYVFASDLKHLATDFIEREKVRQRLLAALPRALEACATIPEAWRFADPEQTVEAAWSEQQFLNTLDRCQDEQNFWNLAS